MDNQTWYASLATMYGSAAAVITDPSGRVLLVKPNYRDHWSLPGGVLEHAEAPHAGCFREVEEEIGLVLPPGRLLTVAWTAPDGERPKPIVSFLFDGGVLADPSGIRLQEEELDDWRFVAPDELGDYLPPFLLQRVAAALTAKAAGMAAYLADQADEDPVT
jgi:8-oxo-dGTP pyrophosphatase MutT (NUDIX family)